MKKLLVLVDFQNDFIDGALGTPEAMAIVPNVIKKVKEWDGDILFTADTHNSNYINTNEGKHLPIPHCIFDTNGWELQKDVAKVLKERMSPTEFQMATFLKKTFACKSLCAEIEALHYDYVEFIGLCTDICVVSNALMLKAFMPEIQIAVDPSCCAGVTPETHEAALTTMKMCQIDILEEVK